MTDPNMTDFYGRVARIQKLRSKGYGFEAPGTLGRSSYYRPKTRRRSIFGPIVFLLACTFLLKGSIYYTIGAEAYGERVAGLRASDGIEAVGGWMMQTETATILVSQGIAMAIAKMK